MSRPLCLATAATLAFMISALPDAQARDLSFDDRVNAHEAIERAYYAHQIGKTRPFEEAVPRAVLEQKVRTYLKQTVALERYWNTPVTAEMLARELERMTRQTRMPERLRELFASLGNDAFLVQECLARPALVDRLSRNFFAYDERIHGAARAEAEELHKQLAMGRIGPGVDHPRRILFRVLKMGKEGRANLADGDHSMLVELAPDEFTRRRARAPDHVGEIGSLVEGRDELVTEVLLDESAREFRVARFVVPKPTWDAWWASASEGFEETQVGTGESTGALLDRIKALTRGQASESAPCIADDTWDNGILDDVPDGYSYHTAVWTGSLMVVWGGNAGVRVNTGSRYDPATDTWTSTSTVNAPSPRSGHTAVWIGGAMVVWGGYDDSGYTNTGGRYDPVTDTWTGVKVTNAPQGRSGHTAVWAGSVMVVWGGRGAGEPAYLYTGGRFDPATDTWTSTSLANAPWPRSGHTAVWTGTRMIVWGGTPGSTTFYNTGGRYDPQTDVWTPTSIVSPPSSREGHSAVWTGSKMVVWGGKGAGSPFNTGGRYDPVTDAWTPTSTVNVPSARRSHTAVWTGISMVVWGGNSGSTYFSTGGRYDPVTDAWTPTSTLNAPAPRSLHTAIWTGTLMVVWGGYGNTGGRYQPVADTWTPTSTAGGPTGRSSHTAVWTGSVMVVWGGSGQNTGGRYDPATDTWEPTSTVNAPQGRSRHTAVWTGRHMLVWGGAYGNLLDTGGRYDPLKDTWAPTSTVNAPLARYYHTAVWTGSLMVVWGGLGEADPYHLGTGGRYDPQTDVWTPTTTTNAPAARVQHTAVWTGRHMVVWGGYDGYCSLDTGGRYDPVLDVWTPTSWGAPDIRDSHAAVWTGKVMLVWGGARGCGSSYSVLNTGGRYNPETNSWAPISTTDAPPARANAEAVWTGRSMVVWGGDEDSWAMNTGGIYDPVLGLWSPTSSVNAPSRRYDHTAVWTGSFMIVWGGAGAISTGGCYALGHAVDHDWDGVTECGGDCNDDQPSVFPGATELCDGLDNDCNGVVDDRDLDGDGYAQCAGDCDDTLASAYPGAPEACGDGVRNDCLHPYWPAIAGTDDDDADGDGVAECQGDCDDAQAPTYPGAPQICDGLNNDCSHPSWPALIDTNDIDDDGDTFAECAGDCDDTRSSVRPGGGQICGDGLNNDCSHPSWPTLAGTNEGDDDGDSFNECGGDCDDALSAVYPGAWEACGDGIRNNCSHPYWPAITGTDDDDVDGDAFAECQGDCDDASAAVYSGAAQICGDGLNNDCRHPTWPFLVRTNEVDDDGDTLTECAGDCDDTHPSIRPGAAQICGDGLNNDCRHPTWPSLAGTNEFDDDGDLFLECWGDCDDTHASVHPGAPQICDGLNNDCAYPDWPTVFGTNDGDDDGDTFTECEGDCDDTQPQVWATPGETWGLLFIDEQTLEWNPPLNPGGSFAFYDVLRTTDPGDFFVLGTCVASDYWDTAVADDLTPARGQVFHYLTRAQNTCPGASEGTLGVSSNGVPRMGASCP